MVLTPFTITELKSLFNENALKVLNYFIHKSIFAQPEPLPGQAPLPIHIPKEHIEQWMVQALRVIPIGSGSYPIDIYKENDWGADVKMLSCPTDKTGELINGDSGETSLAQKFKGSGVDLDSLFRNGNFNDIMSGYGNIVHEKLNSVLSSHNLNNIYYFFILRAGTRFFLCGLHVNIPEIKNISVLRTSRASAWANNYIDEKYGHVKVYKAKKRMELRLKPKSWEDDDFLIELAVPSRPSEKNLLELVQNEDDFCLHKQEIIQNIF